MNVEIQCLTMSPDAWRKASRVGFSAIALFVLVVSAQAGNLVINGSFESITTGPNGPGQFDSAYPYTTVTGWTSDGYNFVFGPGTADTTGSWTPEYSAYLELWGPNNGSNNGLPATSPDGGNFIGEDGAYQVGAISQSISGLTVGSAYQVSFYWAGAQQLGFDGPNTEQFQVSLGSQTQLTAVYSNGSHGFSGWQQQTFTFVADNTTDVLSFLAIGTPNGVPPFSLLDGVSMTAAVPEPAYVGLVGIGLVALGSIRRHQKKRK